MEQVTVRLDGREINEQMEVLQGKHRLDIFLNDQFQQRMTFTVAPMQIVITPNKVVDITPEIEAIIKQNAVVASVAPEVSLARLINDKQIEIKLRTAKRLSNEKADTVMEMIYRQLRQNHESWSGRITMFYQNGNDYKQFTLNF